MPAYFVKPTGGSDSNDGKDPFGFGFTGADYQDTGHADGDFWLRSFLTFTSYTWQAGDQLALTGGAGITPGLYGIAAKISADVLLLTASAGSDSWVDVSSSSGPFATIQKAADTAAAADDVFLMDGASAHAPTQQIDVDTTAGLVFRAATDRGTASSALVTVDGSGISTGHVFSVTKAAAFHHLRITGGLGSGIDSSVRIDLLGCRVDGNLKGLEGAGGKFLFGCEIDSNTSKGIDNGNSSSSGVGRVELHHCSVHDNGGDGIRGSDGGTLSHCLVYDNTDRGLEIVKAGTWQVVHCVFDGNGDDGIGTSGTVDGAELVLLDSVFSHNGGYGVDFYGEPSLKRSSCYYSNTSGAATGFALDRTDLEVDPAFVSRTDGSEDYSLQAGSALRGVGSTSPLSS